jgi:hypothetical protein
MVVPMTDMLSRRAILLAAPALVLLLGCGGDLTLPTSTGEGVGPESMRAAGPVSQPGRIGQPTPEDPTVLVVDQVGNPVGGAEVQWDVTTGSGSVSSARTTTGTDGRASVTWTLGVGIGVQKLRARVDGLQGSPVMFTATVLF